MGLRDRKLYNLGSFPRLDRNSTIGLSVRAVSFFLEVRAWFELRGLKSMLLLDIILRIILILFTEQNK